MMKAHLIGIKRTFALVVCDKRMPRSVCASTESVEVVVLTLCVVETHRSNSQEFVCYGVFHCKILGRDLERACADPESFVKGGPNLITVFFLFFFFVFFY